MPPSDAGGGDSAAAACALGDREGGSGDHSRISAKKHGNLVARGAEAVLRPSALRSSLGRSGTSPPVLGNVKSYVGESETVGPGLKSGKKTFPRTFGDVPDCPKVKCVALKLRTVWGLRVGKIVSSLGAHATARNGQA